MSTVNENQVALVQAVLECGGSYGAVLKAMYEEFNMTLPAAAKIVNAALAELGDAGDKTAADMLSMQCAMMKELKEI